MKKIAIIGLIVMILLIGCKNEMPVEQESFVWGTDNVKVDVVIPVNGQGGVNIPFAYTGAKDDIELVKVKGENVENLKVEVCDDTPEIFDKVKKDGYTLGYLGFSYESDKEIEAVVEGIDISINGIVQEIQFASPLMIRTYNDVSPVYPKMSTDVLMSGINNSLTYVIGCDEKIQVSEYGLTGPFEMMDSTTSVGGKEQQILGTEIEPNSEVKYEVESTVSEEYEYGCLNGNFYVKLVDEHGQEMTYYHLIIQQGAGNYEAAENVLRRVLDSSR